MNQDIMIIDPDNYGCSIWYNGKVQSINRPHNEVAYRIVKYLTKYHECISPQGSCFLDVKILLDTHGFGKYYAYFFDEYGIEYTEILTGTDI